MLDSNTILQNRYRIVRQLGQGGMGTVYEAIDQRVSCVVALKETLATTDSEAGRAFEREASLLANLRHPLLPKVMDHFVEDGGQFLVMEFIHGYDLAELLEVRGTPFATGQVLEWADGLLKVLEYLHGRNPPILHRDLKPSNLKLTKQNEIFVLDFGLAKGAAGQMPTLLTSRSVRGYTPVYSSLEQIHGKGTDPRSDLYSLGATLYHLLTGMRPADAPTRFAEIEDDRPDPLRQIDEVNSQVSRKIASVIHKALSVSRKHRHASAAVMRSELREAEQETRCEEEDRRPDRKEVETQPAERAASRQIELETARRVEEEERIKQEQLETRRPKDAQLRREDQEEIRRRLEHTKASQNVVASTQRSKNPNDSSSTPVVKTLKSEPVQLYQNTDALNGSEAGPLEHLEAENGKRENRLYLRVIYSIIGAVAIVAIVSLLLWGRNSSGDGPQKGSDGQKALNPPSSENATQPQAKATSAAKRPGEIKGIEMVWIPAGSFNMGSNNGLADEKPVHRVTIGQGFFMGKYEVTQAQWKAVMGANPSGFKGDNHPVETVSWNDAQEYINKLNGMTDGYKYRLPTEAEWEYACRAGTTTDFAFGSSLSSDQANFDGDFPFGGAAKGVNREKTTPVGSFAPNAFGLFDMHGNVWEWCEDGYQNSYFGAPSDGRAVSGSPHVLRGGSWSIDASNLRSAVRNADAPVSRYSFYGFRLVAVVRTQ